jgi:hypothetical protein
MTDHRQQALAYALEAANDLELVGTPGEDATWREQAKIEALIAQAEALIYVGDQVARHNDLAEIARAHTPGPVIREMTADEWAQAMENRSREAGGWMDGP